VPPNRHRKSDGRVAGDLRHVVKRHAYDEKSDADKHCNEPAAGLCIHGYTPSPPKKLNGEKCDARQKKKKQTKPPPTPIPVHVSPTTTQKRDKYTTLTPTQ